MKPLVVIPARGGSKGVPGKNIKELNGKPLIFYTLDAARKVFKDEYICVSTDDPKIKQCVESSNFHVPFLRPSHLSLDDSGTRDVLIHAVNFYESKGYYPDVVVLLQPTSPFRSEIHIQEALNLYHDNLDMIVSVKETKSNPYFVLFEEGESGFLKKSKTGYFKRRQDCPTVWEYNGAIYIINTESLKQMTISEFKMVKKYVMDEVSSHDIDTMLDWKVAQSIL